MPKTRSSQISLVDTPFYHCVTRCVRRSFLCGEDKVTGKSYEHRRGWVEERLLYLGSVFAIDICAYAVMSNHTHVVLYVDKDTALGWNTEEVLKRWHRLHKGTLLTQKYMDNTQRDSMSKAELSSLNDTVKEYRKRLFDISWLMRNLNEYIAREANKEDGCTGRFWEGRFKSQALLDEAALAACMTYVDLNPVRAGMEKTPESSAHTSVQQRAEALKADKGQPNALFPFAGNPRQDIPRGLPFKLNDYLELVDLTGREIRQDKKGYIDPTQSPILQRLQIDQDQWLILTTEFEKRFSYAAGGESKMSEYKAHTGLKSIKGISQARALLKSG